MTIGAAPCALVQSRWPTFKPAPASRPPSLLPPPVPPAHLPHSARLYYNLYVIYCVLHAVYCTRRSFIAPHAVPQDSNAAQQPGRPGCPSLGSGAAGSAQAAAARRARPRPAARRGEQAVERHADCAVCIAPRLIVPRLKAPGPRSHRASTSTASVTAAAIAADASTRTIATVPARTQARSYPATSRTAVGHIPVGARRSSGCPRTKTLPRGRGRRARRQTRRQRRPRASSGRGGPPTACDNWTKRRSRARAQACTALCEPSRRRRATAPP